MSNHSAAIEVAGLTKSFGDVVVLTGIVLTVPVGTVYALLGPNGAGKTTMVRIFSTLVQLRDRLQELMVERGWSGLVKLERVDQRGTD